MKPGKYADDYRLENVIGKGGKVKTVPVYVGPVYKFSEEERTVRKTKVVLSVLYILAVAFFAVPMCVVTGCMHVFYVSVPLACLVFPGVYGLFALFTILKAKEEVTRQQYDGALPRLTACCVLSMIFSFASVAGHVFYWIKNGESGLDYAVLLCAVCIFLCNFVIFRVKNGVAMVNIENVSKEEK